MSTIFCNNDRPIRKEDLSAYLKKRDYLKGWTEKELAEVRKNIGAIGKDDLESLIIGGDKFIEVTYDELINYIEDKSLKIGVIYCITDFLSIYESNYIVVDDIILTWGAEVNPSEVCTLLVTAVSEDKLDPRAILISSDPDSTKWEVRYDVTRKTLSDGVTNKGTITYLKDENNNSAYYNFKHIRFRRTRTELAKLDFEISTPFIDLFTFNNEEFQENSKNVVNNEFSSDTFNNVFLSSCNNNKFGVNFKDNTFISECSNNYFGIDTQNNNFKNPVKYVEGTFSNITDDGLLSRDITKKVYRTDDAYTISYLDSETLTLQFIKKMIQDDFRDGIYLKIKNYLSEFVTEEAKAEARKNLGIPDIVTLEWGNIQGDLKNQTDLMDYLKNLELNLSVPEEIIDQAVRNYINSPEFNTVILELLDDYLNDNLTKELIAEAIKNYLDNLDILDYTNEQINNIVNAYLSGDDFKSIINESLNTWIDENLNPEEIKLMILDYVNSLDISDMVTSIVNQWLEDNRQSIIDDLTPYIDEKINDEMTKIREELNQWCTDIERVIANALVRHEQWILEHSET